jgi:Domain of unknown function (DUF4129)
MVTALALSGPPLIGRSVARQLARTELAKPIYNQRGSLADRVVSKIISLLTELFRLANTAVPGGWWAVVVVAALATCVAGVVLMRIGPVARAHKEGRVLPGDSMISARDHRERAARLAGDGDWAGAIREALRAIARDLEERGILPPQPGRTADELAVEAGRALPGYAGELWSAVRLFDDVHYGDRPGSRHGYARLCALDAALDMALDPGVRAVKDTR